MSKNLIVLYSDGKLNIDVEINVEQQTLWVTQKQMEELFDVAHSTISEHISNILKSGGDFCRFFRQKFWWKKT